MPGQRIRFVHALAVLAISAGLIPTDAALADRSPTAEERTRIESVLRENGFMRWGEIEFDDGRWGVDDAITNDGQKFDLKLNDAFVIIGREPD
jgi:hypothetical protein